MTFKLLPPKAFAGGTSLQDFIKNTTLNELTAILGKPQYHPDYNPHPCDDKIQVEWIFTYGGKVMTIYCWKWWNAPGPDLRCDWHLGGFKHDYKERQAFLEWVQREIAVRNALDLPGYPNNEPLFI